MVERSKTYRALLRIRDNEQHASNTRSWEMREKCELCYLTFACKIIVLSRATENLSQWAKRYWEFAGMSDAPQMRPPEKRVNENCAIVAMKLKICDRPEKWYTFIVGPNFTRMLYIAPGTTWRHQYGASAPVPWQSVGLMFIFVKANIFLIIEGADEFWWVSGIGDLPVPLRQSGKLKLAHSIARVVN